MYADEISNSMEIAIEETKRRRKIQMEYNKNHNITPTTIKKEIPDIVKNEEKVEKSKTKMTKKEKQNYLANIEKEMKEAAKNLDFERAMKLRDILFELESE